MTVLERVKQAILKITGGKKLGNNPNSERYQFLGDEETVRIQHLHEYRIWYVGDSDELDNFYLNREVSGNAKNPIYNRNKKKYFWGLSEKECNVKKIHTGIPRAAINTLVNIVGPATITCDAQDKWDKIARVNHFSTKLNQQIRPLTLAEGWGASKLIMNQKVSKVPLIEFYEAEDTDFVVESGVITGIIYKDYYQYQSKNYILLEVRRIEDGNSIIQYQLFRYEKSGDSTEVPLHTIPELECLCEEGLQIPGVGKILGQPIRYFFDMFNKDYGLSILAGKIDIADDMDMLASVESLTEKNSSPISYYPVDLLKRNKEGAPIMPDVFNRQFIKKPTVPNSDGAEDGKIDTEAPQLNFAQYTDALYNKIKMFLSGWLSPSSFGIDLARKDNAEAQREKEKCTIMTRNNIMDMETEFLIDLVNSALMMQEYMDTGKITIQDYNVSVKYNEFANPSMETMLPILGQAWVNGELSTEKYVDMLWADKLSDEDKLKEIQWLDSNKQKDNLSFEDLMNEDTGNGEDSGAEGIENQAPKQDIPGNIEQ